MKLSVLRNAAAFGLYISCSTCLLAQAPPIVKPPVTAVKPPIAKVPNVAAGKAATAVKPNVVKPNVVKPTVVKPAAVPKTVSPALGNSNLTVQQPFLYQQPYLNTFGQTLNGAGSLTNSLNSFSQPATTLNSNLGLNGTNNLLGSTNSLNGSLQNALNGNTGLNSTLSSNAPATPQSLMSQHLATGQGVFGSQAAPSAGLTRNGLTSPNNLYGTAGTSSVSPLVQQQLNLSNGQLSQINQFRSAYNQELNQLNARYLTDPQGTNNLVAQAQQQLQQQVNSVMTPAQRQALSRITGNADPFSSASPLQNPASTTTATGGTANATGTANQSNLNMTNANTNLAGATNAQSATNNLSQLNSISNGAAITRTNPLNLGRGGYLGITNPTVQQALRLSPSQVSQLRNFQLEYIQQLGELNGRFQTDPQGTLSLYNNALQQSTQRIESVLTPQQRLLYSNLTGSPNEFSSGNTLQSTTTSQ